jgi:hypothetical protein
MEQELTLEELCSLLGVLSDNALVVNIWKTLKLNGYMIVKLPNLDYAIVGDVNILPYGATQMTKGFSDKLWPEDLTGFEDYTKKGNNNLTGHTKI